MFRKRSIPQKIALCIAFGAVASPAVAEKRCTAWTAMFATSTEELCECDRVTKGFVAQVQRHSEFARILEESQASCFGLTVILTEVTTFSTSTSVGFDGPDGGGNGSAGGGGSGAGGGPGAGSTN
ncbi:hypothetical protein [Roseovarius tolerans]|uniref:hypothetical protein n=1 Tax=Roseovarius tolerans TaxID=74031 RepID=UPI001113BB3B|nr:hypothetical protein [Roseovarius tolerans]